MLLNLEYIPTKENLSFFLSQQKEQGFISKKTKEGLTWSFPTITGSILNQIQILFGEKDNQYTFLGIEFEKNGPLIWYPGSQKNISIILSTTALENYKQAIFQLSHELIHLLSPSGKQNALILEEGLASFFQMEVSTHLNLEFNLNNERYIKAAKLVRSLFELDFKTNNQNNNIIKRIRNKKPNIKDITKEDILEELSNVSIDNAERLCSPFYHETT